MQTLQRIFTLALLLLFTAIVAAPDLLHLFADHQDHLEKVNNKAKTSLGTKHIHCKHASDQLSPFTQQLFVSFSFVKAKFEILGIACCQQLVAVFSAASFSRGPPQV